MIRILLHLVWFVALLPLPGRAGEIEPLQRIDQVAIAAAAAQLPPTARVAGGSLDPRLRLPACAGAPAAEPPAVRGASATVTVRCSDPAWTIYVPLRISDPRPVVVLTRASPRGETLSDAVLELQTRDVAQLPFGYFESVDALAGQVLRRSVAAGAVLTPADAEPPRLVRRGEAVTVVGRSGGIEVRASGTAMADGAKGQRIRVRNDSSRRIVEGVVVAAATVEIAL